MCRVVDGDTLVVRFKGKENIIRLYGIDAPEQGQPYYQEAKGYLESIVGERVDLYKMDRKKSFRRTVAIVYSGSNRDESLNIQMLRSGYAHYAPYSGNLNVAEEIQQEAKRERRGMWASEVPLATPWDYRARTENESASQNLEFDRTHIEDMRPRQPTRPHRQEIGRRSSRPKSDKSTISDPPVCVALALTGLLIFVLLLTSVCNS